MKLVSALAAMCLAQTAMSFTPSSPAFVRQSTQVASSGMDLSGNSWKPESEKMGVSYWAYCSMGCCYDLSVYLWLWGNLMYLLSMFDSHSVLCLSVDINKHMQQSTDTGDYFPEGYEADVDYTDGMMGSQTGGGNRDGPALPGLENLGEDAVLMGGIEQASEIPAGMEFIPSSVPDGEFSMSVAGSSSGSYFLTG